MIKNNNTGLDNSNDYFRLKKLSKGFFFGEPMKLPMAEILN